MKTQNANEVIKSSLIEKLNDYKNTTVYGRDLAYTLFEGENATGSVSCNTYQAKEFIKENFDLFVDLLEYYKDNFDMVLNPFIEPENAELLMYLECASSLLSQCEFIDKNWNNEIELTTNNISIIKEQLELVEICF